MNLIFCCCFNDPPFYKYKNEKDDFFECAKINWVLDKICSKEEFLMEKHNITWQKRYSYRLFIMTVLFIIFIVFPQTLYIIYYQIYISKTFVKNAFYLMDLLMSFCLVLIMIFYVKLNRAFKGLIDLLLMITLLIVFIIYSIKILSYIW